MLFPVLLAKPIRSVFVLLIGGFVLYAVARPGGLEHVGTRIVVASLRLCIYPEEKQRGWCKVVQVSGTRPEWVSRDRHQVIITAKIYYRGCLMHRSNVDFEKSAQEVENSVPRYLRPAIRGTDHKRHI